MNHYYASEGNIPTSPAAAPPVAPSAGDNPALSPDDYAALLVDLYQRCNPSKVAEVPALLEQFKGRERELFETVQAKYGQGVPTGTSAYAAQQVEERRSVAAHPAAVYLAEMRQYVGEDPSNEVSVTWFTVLVDKIWLAPPAAVALPRCLTKAKHQHDRWVRCANCVQFILRVRGACIYAPEGQAE